MSEPTKLNPGRYRKGEATSMLRWYVPKDAPDKPRLQQAHQFTEYNDLGRVINGGLEWVDIPVVYEDKP